MAKNTREEKPLNHLDIEKIIDVELNTELKRAYIDYSMSVIVGRALPDVRDGLKPVHRRIIIRCMRTVSLPTRLSVSLPPPSVTCSVAIIPTATAQFTMQWYVLHSLSHSAILW